MKKYIKVSFNTTEEIYESINKLVEESDDFGITRTIIINRILVEYFKKEKNKELNSGKEEVIKK